ncbi:cAMP-responsive element-binding protein-like 2 [Penaeus monodon]|uniref:cAMP-responsive element-binding protein-like 2 n=1 Tax=Penaeus monodon TaxID=6687 RepID=UPI0018A7967A|nr:cAMP-responsive element-binding protein-like 2 [Penaeus monodon]
MYGDCLLVESVMYIDAGESCACKTTLVRSLPPPQLQFCDISQIYIDSECGSKREGTKRGRKPGRKAKSDMKAKLERSRQSARECRARKKLRYQYLEELVANREKAVFALHRELDQYRQWAKEIDEGKIPEGFQKLIEEEKVKKAENE